LHRFNGLSKETREGWPLLAVDTEVNGDSKSTNVRLWLSLDFEMGSKNAEFDAILNQLKKV
jgi:hypothetical protein